MKSLRWHDISDRLWNNIKDHLPGREGVVGRNAYNNRKFIDAVFWIWQNRTSVERFTRRSRGLEECPSEVMSGGETKVYGKEY